MFKNAYARQKRLNGLLNQQNEKMELIYDSDQDECESKLQLDQKIAIIDRKQCQLAVITDSIDEVFQVNVLNPINTYTKWMFWDCQQYSQNLNMVEYYRNHLFLDC